MIVMLTGSTGFLGRAVLNKLKEKPKYEISAPSHEALDLRNQADVEIELVNISPEVIINCAGTCAGIGANHDDPYPYFYNNISMGLNLMDQAAEMGVRKFIQIGTVCSYPKTAKFPRREEDLWSGYPEETNGPYGVAKRVLLEQARILNVTGRMQAVGLILANLYGPGDNFKDGTSHVIPSLIKKFSRAVKEKHNNVDIWGNGQASREFLYVDDAAEAIIGALEKYTSPEPVNIGSGTEIKISEVVSKIAALIGYNDFITYDEARPSGEDRRLIDSSRAKQFFTAKTDFDEGLKRTLDYYTKITQKERLTNP